MHIKSILPAILLLSSHSLSAQRNAYTIVRPLPEKLEVLPFGAVKPTGWLQQQIQENLDGFTGYLDTLAPDLILHDDIYDKDRLTKRSKPKQLGALGDEGDWNVQLYWWNSETQSNWRDGYIRSAILANDTMHLRRIKTYINAILQSQDADGYLGIYDRELRYKFDNENGELWAKATLLRALVAWYEYTHDQKVLTAIKRAVQNTMDNYPADQSHPFYSKNPYVGGLSHGLAFTDVLEQLYYITRNRKYVDYALFLYKDFSMQTLSEDAQLKKLFDPSVKLLGHGVHTYEHLRSLAAAYYASGNDSLLQALHHFEAKINDLTTASGGPVGDEWIGGRPADATKRGYEYCSLQELMNSYESLYAKTGNKQYGDKVEHLFFNAAQGARNPEESCIAYLKSDNSYYMTGGLNGDTSDAKQTRYRYSPVHREAAVCCVPNAGRIAPYYTQYMWLKDKKGLVASLLGPCTLQTRINNKPVSITEETAYPFENKVTFVVAAPGLAFDLKIRKPGWATAVQVNMPYTEQDGFIIISKKWTARERVALLFTAALEAKTDNNGEHYFEYGGLVLAHAIAATPQVTKSYTVQGLADYNYRPDSLTLYTYIPQQAVMQKAPLQFETLLRNTATRQAETVILQPMGQTILRQVTFKDGKE